MTANGVQPRVVAFLAALALFPVVAFVVGRTTIAAVALVNVLLITAALFYAMSPTGTDDGDDAEHAA